MSKETATLDQTKGKTLDEISAIVTDITQTLKERKNKLAPQIKELRAVRQRYQELEGAFLNQKGKYEHTAVGLETERARLQKECDQLQVRVHGGCRSSDAVMLRVPSPDSRGDVIYSPSPLLCLNSMRGGGAWCRRSACARRAGTTT